MPVHLYLHRHIELVSPAFFYLWGVVEDSRVLEDGHIGALFHLGTGRKRTISTWSQSAPSPIVLEHAAPRAAKSALRIDGAIMAGGVMVGDVVVG